MSRQVQLRRGTADEHKNFTGAAGEITIDTTSNTIRVHDGETAGGTPLARASDMPDLSGADYVVAWQVPAAENNYVWYRKYKSGWVEQGGIGQIKAENTSFEIKLPIIMKNESYTLIATSESPTSTSIQTPHGCHYINKNKYGASIISLSGASGDWIATNVCWYVCGH